MWRWFENFYIGIVVFVFYYVMGFFIVVFVMVNVIEIILCGVIKGIYENFVCGEWFEVIFFCLDIVCVMIFIVEYLFCFYVVLDRCKFMCSVMSVIDVVVIFFYYIGFVIIDNDDVSGVFVMFWVFCVFRIFKFFCYL